MNDTLHPTNSLDPHLRGNTGHCAGGSRRLQQLKPNAILETIRSWTPGLLSLSYRVLYAAVIIIIGNRIAFYLRRFLKRTFDHMNMDLSLSKFLISLANAITYAIVIFMALEK